ncbi:MAG TPA: hypothetical protein PK657_10310 [Legionella sp.]|nr:hypothetical protein [Legionella sp.]
MKVQKIKLSSYDVTWIVLDDNHLPIKPITEFVRYLNNVDKSPCTEKLRVLLEIILGLLS